MARKLISSGSAYEPLIGFSRAVRVGNRVLVSATAPIWPNGFCDPDPKIQARRCIEIIISALREAGAGPQHVVRTRAYITHAAIGEDVAEAHAEVFRTVLPASSIIVVSGFLDARWKIQVEAEAVVDE